MAPRDATPMTLRPTARARPMGRFVICRPDRKPAPGVTRARRTASWSPSRS
jgi:hypothetical protein